MGEITRLPPTVGVEVTAWITNGRWQRHHFLMTQVKPMRRPDV
jgi:hypothetical protein